MTGDVVDFELRLVHLMNGNVPTGVRIQVRKLVVDWPGPHRTTRWGEWEDAPEIMVQTASLAAQQRMAAKPGE